MAFFVQPYVCTEMINDTAVFDCHVAIRVKGQGALNIAVLELLKKHVPNKKRMLISRMRLIMHQYGIYISTPN